MRHKTIKKIYRIITDSGIVDVTEDHSLLDIECNKIRPLDINLNQELLHKFPLFNNDIIIKNFDFKIKSKKILSKIMDNKHGKMWNNLFSALIK